jgi:hypothetical protein
MNNVLIWEPSNGDLTVAGHYWFVPDEKIGFTGLEVVQFGREQFTVRGGAINVNSKARQGVRVGAERARVHRGYVMWVEVSNINTLFQSVKISLLDSQCPCRCLLMSYRMRTVRRTKVPLSKVVTKSATSEAKSQAA